MSDWWYAECLPCKWQEKYTDEPTAIAAAEAHVMDHHSRVPPLERAKQVMGHVQLRAGDTVGAPVTSSAPGAGDVPTAAVQPPPTATEPFVVDPELGE